jgi:hypothetical protein
MAGLQKGNVMEANEKLNELSELQDQFHNLATQVYFRAGLLACREYMARFFETENQSIADSIRANWFPALGEDFGSPRLLLWEELTNGVYGEPDFEVKADISPTLEALPLALQFLEDISSPQPSMTEQTNESP